MNILILAPFEGDQLARLRSRASVTHESWVDSQKIYDPEELGKRLAKEKIDCLLIEIDFVFPELLEQTQKLKLVGMCRAALNQVDIPACIEHGIGVIYTPARNANAVAEHTIGLIFALARHISQADSFIKRGDWKTPLDGYQLFKGYELEGKTAGVIGLGAIGEKVAGKLSALGMHILAYDPFVSAEKAGKVGASIVSLETLVRESDVITLHIPHTDKTDNLLNERHFSNLKPNALLINTASPSVVDEFALVSALRSNRIAGAALDVFTGHPISPASPFLALPNVILTPHIGGATHETVRRYSEMLTDDIFRFMDGKQPLHMANPEVWHASR